MTIMAYINDDLKSSDDRKFGVELYYSNKHKEYIETYDIEFYSTLNEANNRVNQINKGERYGFN